MKDQIVIYFRGGRKFCKHLAGRLYDQMNILIPREVRCLADVAVDPGLEGRNCFLKVGIL